MVSHVFVLRFLSQACLFIPVVDSCFCKFELAHGVNVTYGINSHSLILCMLGNFS